MNRGGKERENKGILTTVSGTITDIKESSSPPNKARKMMSIVIYPKRYVKYRGNTLLLFKKTMPPNREATSSAEGSCSIILSDHFFKS